MRYVTVTNRGYSAYVLNWLTAARRAGVNVKDCRVYCADHASAEALSHTGVDLALEPTDFPQPGVWLDAAFISASWMKLICLMKEAKRGHPFIFSDPDLVFHTNPGAYLNEVSGVDLVAQASIERDNGRFRLCSGFMYLLPTENTQRLLHVTEADRLTFQHDEALLNARIDADMSIRWLALPVDRFPDGSYGGRSELRSRFVTHFNYIVGSPAKWRKMVTAGQWFIDMKPEGCE